METTFIRTRRDIGVTLVAVAGAAWNLFGVVQFIGTLNQTPHSLMMGGMTAAQAAAYHGLPAWMTVAFAVGTFGGLAGATLLMLRRAQSPPVLAASLAAYIALFGGDWACGLFVILPRQLLVLLLVEAVAVLLLATAVSASGGLDAWKRGRWMRWVVADRATDATRR